MKVFALTMLLAAAAAALAFGRQNELLTPLDQAVNAMLDAAGTPNRGISRVVPIVRSGGVPGGYAQIIGDRAAVAHTRAVLEISTAVPSGWSIDALIPVTTISRTSGTIHRSYGVAVDAIVNGRL
jgi:hypothetical protein